MVIGGIIAILSMKNIFYLAAARWTLIFFYRKVRENKIELLHLYGCKFKNSRILLMKSLRRLTVTEDAIPINNKEHSFKAS